MSESRRRNDDATTAAQQGRSRFPRLGREERVELLQRLEESAQADWDYVMMITLAAVLASLGLLQDATAVVIGAMLVAPLMGPLVALGLALVQGNAPLFRTGLRSTAIGIGIVLGVSLIAGLINPGYEPALEIEARGEPDVFDLGIALASGMAAAYASSRPKVAATVAGVAIAAALVPPLAVVGLAVTNQRPLIAAHASILFLTNLVAIVLGTAIVYAMLGVRMKREGEITRVWVRRATVALIGLAILLSAPLVMNVIEKRRAGQSRPLMYPVAPHVREAVQDYLALWPDFQVVSMSRSSVEPDAGTTVVVLCRRQLEPILEAGLIQVVQGSRGDAAPVSVFPVRSARADG
jgi:uncharacterized hydrophobic protein (TIGR00271 family)